MNAHLYRPSNGSEGMWFDDRWCSRCIRDQEWRETDKDGLGCPILTATFIYNVDEPEYPKEWVIDDECGARCIAFYPIDDGSLIMDTRQLPLPLVVT